MPKRKCTFSSDLKKEYPFLKHIIHDRVLCTQCRSEFSISHGGRSSIKDHLSTKKHKTAVESVASTSSITTFFKDPNKDDLITAKEATFAFHSVVHNISFNTSDCNSKLLSKFFEPKFSLGRTKCQTIVQNVITPYWKEKLQEDLNETNFVTITIDASNKGDLQMIPVMVRYFLPHKGVQVKMLDFQSVPGEKSEILTNQIFDIISKYKISDKIIGFCADNCNTNFGGVARRGKNNVYFRLKELLKRNIIGIGCVAHIIHNCIQNAVDILPFDIEVLVVKIYKYFYIYTVRVTELKEFCQFANVEYQRVLKHGNTRFLSLLPAIKRIIAIFEGLKSYFASQENCPQLINNFFSNPAGELYLNFVSGQLNLFNSAILKVEKNNISATEVICELKNLKMIIHERRENKFIPQEAKLLVPQLEENGDINLNVFLKHVDKFYEVCESYISLWQKNFDEVEEHTWAFHGELNWDDIEKSMQLLNSKFKSNTPIISSDSLFDEVVYAKQFYNDTARNKLWRENSTSSEEKWIQLFKNFSDKNISINNLQKIVEFIFCLPGTSASIERLFSIMKSVWSPERNRLLESNVGALLFCKTNINLTCSEFYDYIKSDKHFLNKVQSVDKYYRNK